MKLAKKTDVPSSACQYIYIYIIIIYYYFFSWEIIKLMLRYTGNKTKYKEMSRFDLNWVVNTKNSRDSEACGLKTVFNNVRFFFLRLTLFKHIRS